jgi:hypothetical protein
MTPLIIGIDPGTKQSAYVAWNGQHVFDLATVENWKVVRYLRTIPHDACVCVENIEPYGMNVGREVLETMFWIGRFYQAARDTVGPKQVSRLPRRAVKKHLGLKPGAGDKDVRAALVRALEHNPIEWYDLRSHQVSALAIAVTWWNTERARQPLKGQESKHVGSAIVLSQ